MNIDEAIKQLQKAKDNGTKNVIFYFSVAGDFDLNEDSSEWAEFTQFTDAEYDWINVHDEHKSILDFYLG